MLTGSSHVMSIVVNYLKIKHNLETNLWIMVTNYKQ